MKYLNKPHEKIDQPIQAKSRSNAGFRLEDHRQSSIIQRKQVAALSGLNTMQLKSEVIQLVSDEEVEASLENVKQYSSYAAHYDDATIKRVLKAKDLKVRGHASGTGGDGMNAATKRDLAVLIAALQKDAAARRATEEIKEDAPYGAAASSSSGKHQSKAEKKATDTRKEKKSADHATKKRQDWLAKQARR